MKRWTIHDFYKAVNKWAFGLAQADDRATPRAAMLRSTMDGEHIIYMDNILMFRIPERYAVVDGVETPAIANMFSRFVTEENFSVELRDTEITIPGSRGGKKRVLLTWDGETEVHINERYAKIVEGCDLRGNRKDPAGRAIAVYEHGTDNLLGFVMPIRVEQKDKVMTR